MSQSADEIQNRETAKEAAPEWESHDVRGLQSILHFYKLLKIKTSVATDEKSQARYKFHRKYLSKIKVFFLVLYIVVNPIVDAPRWCIRYYQDDESFDRWSVTLDC